MVRAMFAAGAEGLMGTTIETMRAVAHPWLCDTMGHMNVRHYAAIFDDASWHLLAAAGHGPERFASTGCGWADVRQTIEYRREVIAGALVVVRSQMVRVGRTSLTYRHAMHAVSGDALHATMDAVTVFFDLAARQAVALPEVVREAAGALIVGVEV